MPAAISIILIAIAGLLVVASAACLLRSPTQTGRRILCWWLWLRGLQERFLETSGARIHYYELKPRAISREAVIFLTGLGGTGVDWHEMLTAASRGGRQVFSLELAGQGQTRLKNEPERYSMQIQLQLLRDFLDFQKLYRVTIIGISLGGWIASLFAISYPERIHNLVLVASAGLRSPLTPRDIQPRNRKEARIFLNRVLALDPWVPGFILDDFVHRLNSVSNRKIINAITESDLLDAQLHRIQIPVDLVWGTEDELIGIEQAYRFQSGIPHARLHLIRNCGHIPMLERPWIFRHMLTGILAGTE